ncbi:MAG: GNAT family N-acetyltransferase [Acholeplasmataceae bacterium]|nr:GNAT family N-acetyltransferase [Acholeplasmataceae bacterium]
MPMIMFDNYMLRTLKLHDAKDMFDYGKDPEVTKYLSWGPFHHLEEAKWSIKNIFFKRYKQELPIGYAIVDVHTSKMIGTIDFHSKIKGENGAEIGYALHKDYWNKGIMSKAIKELIQIGFEYLGYDFIKIKHLSLNQASGKVIQKAGFSFIRKEPYILEKATTVLSDDMMIYELTKESYYGNKQS